jgi:[acyl-carrier-protein] S-malonyltransferase
MKIAFLFSGQGVQYAGMGQNLYENYTESKEIFEKASSQLGWDVKEVCFHDSNHQLNQTRYTQGALFTTNLAAYYAAIKHGIKPEAVVGFSLGEYAALVASGALSLEDGLKLVDQRAQFMDQCAKEQKGKMAAVIGLDGESIEAVCASVRTQGKQVVVANDNCPGQVIISGEDIAIEEAATLLKEKGARRVMILNVSGAFHSPLMEDAANSMKEAVSEVGFLEPTIPIVSNVSAKYMTKEQIIENIPLQIMQGVRFRESILYLLAQGFDTFIEIGVKKTLCGFVSKINKEAKVLNIEDVESLKKTLEELGGALC